MPEGLSLGAVRAECWGGFVFVNLDPDAEPLLDYLQPLPELLAAYHLDRMRLPRRTRRRSSPRTGRWSSTRSTRRTTCRARTRSCCRGPMTSRSHTNSSASTRTTAVCRKRVASCARARGWASQPGDYDEGEILAGLVGGLGRLFLKDELAIVEELRSSPPDPPETLLHEFQKRRRDAARVAWSRRVGALARSDDERGRRVLLPEPRRPDLSGLGDRVPHPAERARSRQQPSRTPGRSSGRRPGETEGKWEQRFYPDWTEKDWGEITNQDYANMLEVQTGMKSRGFQGRALEPASGVERPAHAPGDRSVSARVKHAGPAALDSIEPMLAALRALPGLNEKKRGTFYRGSEGIHPLPRGPCRYVRRRASRR